MAIPSAGMIRIGIFNFVILSTICGIIVRSVYAEATQTRANKTDKIFEASDMCSKIIAGSALFSVFTPLITGGQHGSTRTSQ